MLQKKLHYKNLFPIILVIGSFHVHTQKSRIQHNRRIWDLLLFIEFNADSRRRIPLLIFSHFPLDI